MFKKLLALVGTAFIALQGTEAKASEGNLRNLNSQNFLRNLEEDEEGNRATITTGTKETCTSNIMTRFDDIVNFAVARENPYISWIERKNANEYQIHSLANYTNQNSFHNSFQYDDALYSIKVTADGKYLLLPIPVEDGTYLYDIETLQVKEFYSIIEDFEYDPDEDIDGEENSLWLLDSNMSPNGEFIVQSLANNHIVIQDFENTKYIDLTGNYYGTYKISVGDNAFLTNRTSSFVELFSFDDIDSVDSPKDVKKYDLKDSDTSVKINAASFSPDGKVVATAGYNGFIHVFDTQDGSLIGVLDQHEGNPILGIDFNNNSTQLATIDNQGNIIITYFDESGVPSNYTKYDQQISNFNNKDQNIARNIFFGYDNQQLLYLTKSGGISAFTIQDCKGKNHHIELDKDKEDKKGAKAVNWVLILIIVGGIIGGLIFIGTIVTLCKICAKRRNQSEASIQHSKKSSQKSNESNENYDQVAEKKSNSTISQDNVIAQQSGQQEPRPVYAQPPKQRVQKPKLTLSELELQKEINNNMSSNNESNNDNKSQTLSQQLQQIIQDDQEQDYDAKESEQDQEEEQKNQNQDLNQQQQQQLQQQQSQDEKKSNNTQIIKWESENVPDEDIQQVNKIVDYNKNNINSNNNQVNNNSVIAFEEQVDSAEPPECDS